MTTTALSAAEFGDALQSYYVESADDARKVIVGLQEQSRSAEIYRSWQHLFTTEQLGALHDEMVSATDADTRERTRRLWFEAAAAVAARDIVQASQDLQNERLAWRTSWDGADVSYNALGALMSSEPDFDRREELFQRACDADEHFAPAEMELLLQSTAIRSETYGLDGEVAIANASAGIDIPSFSTAITAVAEQTRDAFIADAAKIVPELLGRDAAVPSRAHGAWMRSLHIFDDVYTRERMLDVCRTTLVELGFPLESIPNIMLDLEDRPQKNPRACVIPTQIPEEVHLVLLPTGGITDYQAFLHEAGHALHFALTSPELPFEYRYLSPDNALTEIYSYIVERITHNPLWHERHFGLSSDEARRACDHVRYIDSSMFRRYAAKLAYELEFWADPSDPRNPDRYAMMLSNATNTKYPTSSYLSDMDPGLYAADYLRAWRTSEQVLSWLEREHGADWFCNGTAATVLRELFASGTRPTNEEISRRIGSSPDDYSDLTRGLLPS